MTRYRLYTERKLNLRNLVTKAGFQGATIYDTSGIWEGQVEESAIIELIADPTFENQMKIGILADTIKKVNKQDAVMLTMENVQMKML